MGTFDIFDYPRSVKRIAVTPGYTQQSGPNAGDWVPPVEVTTNIKAHISDLSLREMQFVDPAVISAGARKLACESTIGMKPEDRVLITELSGEESEWIVLEKLYASGMLNKMVGVSRESFLLKRKT